MIGRRTIGLMTSRSESLLNITCITDHLEKVICDLQVGRPRTRSASNLLPLRLIDM